MYAGLSYHASKSVHALTRVLTMYCSCSVQLPGHCYAMPYGDRHVCRHISCVHCLYSIFMGDMLSHADKFLHCLKLRHARALPFHTGFHPSTSIETSCASKVYFLGLKIKLHVQVFINSPGQKCCWVFSRCSHLTAAAHATSPLSGAGSQKHAQQQSDCRQAGSTFSQQYRNGVG